MLTLPCTYPSQAQALCLLILSALYPHIPLPFWHPNLEASQAPQSQHHLKLGLCRSSRGCCCNSLPQQKARPIFLDLEMRKLRFILHSSLPHPQESNCCIRLPLSPKHLLMSLIHFFFPVPLCESSGHCQLIRSSPIGSSLNMHNSPLRPECCSF